MSKFIKLSLIGLALASAGAAAIEAGAARGPSGPAGQAAGIQWELAVTDAGAAYAWGR